jgi:CRISPR-associated protein Csm4
MSKYKLIKLNFSRNLAHFGELGIGLEETNERVKSDTLFSAIITSYARLFGKEETDTLLSKFTDSYYPFRHSSTFVYQNQENNNCLYYLPKPFYFPQGYPIGKDLDFTKTYKTLNYLPLSIWQRWYQGNGFSQQDQAELTLKTSSQGDSNGNLAQAGLFKYKDAFKFHQLPKVAIDRNSSHTNFYHTGFVQFQSQKNQESGLYFILEILDKTIETKLQATLQLLGEEGLGGERSTGAGRFELLWENLPQQWQNVLNFQSTANHALISLFWNNSIPQKLIENSYYEIKERGGWIYSPFSGSQIRRKKVKMFIEGSVFSGYPQGKLADVTPGKFAKHSIYRSGISFSIPVKIFGL